MRPFPRLSALLLPWALLVACPSDDDDDDATLDDDDATDPPRVEQWLSGDSVFTLSSGNPTPATRVLIHRVLDASDDSLLEDVWQEDQAGPMHYELVGTIDPDSGDYSFSFYDGFGNLEGTGHLDGEPWAWDHWQSRTEYVDGPAVGSYVLSEDSLSETRLVADKQVFRSDDVAQGTIREELDLVDEATWQAELATLQGR